MAVGIRMHKAPSSPAVMGFYCSYYYCKGLYNFEITSVLHDVCTVFVHVRFVNMSVSAVYSFKWAPVCTKMQKGVCVCV